MSGVLGGGKEENKGQHQVRKIVAAGDEHGIQGRFDQHFKQVISNILGSQDMGIVFEDFKCTTERLW